jgi:hypothetical protein
LRKIQEIIFKRSLLVQIKYYFSMKRFINVLLLIFFFNQISGQIKNKNYPILHEWELSCNIAMDSICKISSKDFYEDFMMTKSFFKNYCNTLRIMALENITEKFQNRAILNISNKILYFIELYSNGYCAKYSLYIVDSSNAYLFETLCASRIVRIAKTNKSSLLAIDQLIKKFKAHGDSMYGITCMITKIHNSNYNSFPLLYFNSNEIDIIRNIIAKKWEK